MFSMDKHKSYIVIIIKPCLVLQQLFLHLVRVLQNQGIFNFHSSYCLLDFCNIHHYMKMPLVFYSKPSISLCIHHEISSFFEMFFIFSTLLWSLRVLQHLRNEILNMDLMWYDFEYCHN